MDHSSAPKKRSIKLRGHATSISLEDAFWQALVKIAAEENRSLQKLVEFIDENRDGNLSSALRLYVLRDLQSKVRHI